jgi:hypothetical protein
VRVFGRSLVAFRIVFAVICMVLKVLLCFFVVSNSFLPLFTWDSRNYFSE